EERNRQIVEDVVKAIEGGRSPILLTERREHLQQFAERLAGRLPNVIVLSGGMNKRRRDELADQLTNIPSDQPRLILATGRYIGEGFDDSRLDTLFLAMPISWRGTLQQYVGRLH